MNDKLYLTIDSSQLETNTPGSITLLLENYQIDRYTRITLEHVYIQHEGDVRLLFQFNARTKPIYIHCNLLNKDDNLINGEKSDVIGIIYPKLRRSNMLSEKFGCSCPRLTKPDTKIEMTLTSIDGTPVDNRIKFTVIYELKFSWF